jgi:hypothetical protein
MPEMPMTSVAVMIRYRTAAAADSDLAAAAVAAAADADASGSGTASSWEKLVRPPTWRAALPDDWYMNSAEVTVKELCALTLLDDVVSVDYSYAVYAVLP